MHNTSSSLLREEPRRIYTAVIPSLSREGEGGILIRLVTVKRQ
jgi:hypothetical protein